MLSMCFGRDNKKDKKVNIYYCNSCKKNFNCLYTHIHSDEHINNSNKMYIPEKKTLLNS